MWILCRVRIIVSYYGFKVVVLLYIGRIVNVGYVEFLERDFSEGWNCECVV